MSLLASISLSHTHIHTQHNIVNFKTHVSGVTANHIKCGVSMAAAQRQVRAALQGCIVVGHDIKHDFAALGLNLGDFCVVDTAYLPVLSEPMGLRPPRIPSLRALVRFHLQHSIQEAEHCSIEDAKVGMGR